MDLDSNSIDDLVTAVSPEGSNYSVTHKYEDEGEGVKDTGGTARDKSADIPTNNDGSA